MKCSGHEDEREREKKGTCVQQLQPYSPGYSLQSMSLQQSALENCQENPLSLLRKNTECYREYIVTEFWMVE